MITQYSEYGTVSSDIQNLIANKVGLLDDYILMRTGELEYSALIKDNVTKEVTRFVISRESSYNSTYTIKTYSEDTFSYTVNNEYYVYSNQRLGRSLSCPIYEQVTSYGICIMTCVLVFAILFKGVLFRCLRRRR